MLTSIHYQKKSLEEWISVHWWRFQVSVAGKKNTAILQSAVAIVLVHSYFVVSLVDCGHSTGFCAHHSRLMPNQTLVS
jgi:hypothetical protein